MTKKNTFDETHGDLIKSFFELYVSNKEFSLKWEREFRSALLMEGRKIDTEYISKDTQDSFKNLKTFFNACLAEIKKNKMIIKPKNEAMFFVFRSLLVDLLDNLARSFEHNLPFLQPHQVLAISGLFVYDQYRKYIFSKNQIFKIYVFLSNFSLNTGDEREIKPLKDIKIIKDVNYFFERDEFLGLKKDTALVFEFKTEKFGNIGSWNADYTINSFQYPHEEIKKELYAILTAFRLLKKGDIGVSAIKCVSPSPFSKFFSVNPDPDFLVQFIGEQYQLEKSDLNEFKALYKMMKEKPDCNELNICISRFNKSYTRNDITDQIIDLAIAMETITTKTWDSLSYKVKTQLARLIENDKVKRKELAGKIGDIYTIRSQLVHSGKINGKKLQNKTFADGKILLGEARDILKNTINSLLSLMKKKSFSKIFDNVIYS